jgi:hypothetical protein
VNQRLTAVAAVIKDITCSPPQETNSRVNVSGGLSPFTYRVSINGAAYAGCTNCFFCTTSFYPALGIIGSTYEFEIPM